MKTFSYLIHQTYSSIRNEGIWVCLWRIFLFLITGRGNINRFNELQDSSFLLPQKYVLKGDSLLLMSGVGYIKQTKKPLVSIIIPFKDRTDLLRTCLDSILLHTSYSNIEILLISNNSTDNDVFSSVKEYSKMYPCIRFFEHNVVFNYAEINNWAVQHAQGEYIIFLNNDTKLITPDWIQIFLEIITKQHVGIVGCRLYYPNETIQHAGIYISLSGYPHHTFRGISSVEAQLFDKYSRKCSAVTGACLCIKKDLFLSVGGFDEVNFPVDYNDIDLCFKVRERGLSVVYTPKIELYHYESVSRGLWSNLSIRLRAQSIGSYLSLKKRWPHFLKGDPYVSIVMD